MDWSTKIFHYKIVDEKGKTVGFVHKKLGELESFVNESNLYVKKLERTGPNDFLVEVSKDSGWKI
tara:strand:- start:908 stop:1102 length:195 start_codon:yes stop_codon:yes gene_type:complete